MAQLSVSPVPNCDFVLRQQLGNGMYDLTGDFVLDEATVPFQAYDSLIVGMLSAL